MRTSRPGSKKPISGGEPDLREIRTQIRKPYTDSDGQGPDITVSGQDVPTDNPTDFTMFVVDDERELLVSNRKLQRFPEGERFRSESFDGLDPLLENALNGEGNSAELSETVDGRWLVVTPVENESGDVAGAVVGYHPTPEPDRRGPGPGRSNRDSAPYTSGVSRHDLRFS